MLLRADILTLRLQQCRSPFEKSQFLPDRNVTLRARQSCQQRHHSDLLGEGGRVKGCNRRQPAREARPLRLPLSPSSIDEPCVLLFGC
jgi:hypothetical protein